MAKYFKQEMPDLRNTGEKKFYYRMKVNENIDFDELVRRLTYPGSGLDKGQSQPSASRWRWKWLLAIR